jgi:hypothetical protein
MNEGESLMDQPTNDHPSQFLSRRDALKAIIAAGGATAFSALPDQWETPLVKVGALPAFAQTSPAQYPFTNEIEGIEFEGISSNDVQFAVQPGWLVLAPAGTQVGAAAYGYPWIIDRPWLKIKRKFVIVSRPWGASIKVKIKINFKKLPGFGSSNNPADDVDLSCFVLAGADISTFSYFVTKFKIKKKKVEIELELPAFSEGFWPFYISCAFLSPITLLSGASLFPGYYLGPCIFGESVRSSLLR